MKMSIGLCHEMVLFEVLRARSSAQSPKTHIFRYQNKRHSNAIMMHMTALLAETYSSIALTSVTDSLAVE
jgi:hypothetical protein